jgi:hypothetical protein
MSNARHSRKMTQNKTVDTFEIIKKEEIETVPVMLMKSMIVKTNGKITGKQYIFSGAGSIVYVDKEDADEMKKNVVLRQSCCGSYSSPYFSFL